MSDLGIADNSAGDTRGRKPLSKEDAKVVTDFYQRDDISRQAPGMREYKKVDGHEEQKRHMYTTIKEAFHLYQEDTTIDSKPNISLSKFFELRPKHVLPLSDMPHNVCVCTAHDNMSMMLSSLHKMSKSIPQAARELIDSVVCDRHNRMCMQSECDECKSVDDYLWAQMIDPYVDPGTECKWMRWRTEDGKSFRANDEGSLEQLIAAVKAGWVEFLLHCYVKDVQSAYFERCLSEVGSDETTAVVQVDFSENFQTVTQDANQASYYTYEQVVVFTCCVWQSSGVSSVCLISDHIKHDKKYAVHKFMENIFKLIKEGSSKIKTVKVFSDGAASQFKQRYLFSNLPWYKTAFDLDGLEWNFFATSHGKGAVDGVGGTIKRAVYRRIMARRVKVHNASTFVSAANAIVGSKIKAILVRAEDIEADRPFLDCRWEGVCTLKGTQGIHHVAAGDESYQVHHSQVAGVPKKTFCMRPVSFAKAKSTELPSQTEPEISAPLVKKSLPANPYPTSEASASSVTTKTLSRPTTGDFVVVGFSDARHKSMKRYVCVIKSVDENDVELDCLRRQKPSFKLFVKPNQPDQCWQPKSTILKKLPVPRLDARGRYEFGVDIDNIE